MPQIGIPKTGTKREFTCILSHDVPQAVDEKQKKSTTHCIIRLLPGYTMLSPLT